MMKRRVAVLFLLVLGSVGIALLADRYGNLTRTDDLEQRTLDWRQITAYESRRSGEAESPIALVFFDEAATSSWPYLSPFPRAFLADLIRALDDAGARTIGLDVYLERTYPALNEMDGGDDRLRQAMEAAGNVVLVAPTLATEDGPVLQPPDPFFAEAAVDVGAADLPTAFETIREAPLAVRSGDALQPSFSLAVFAHSRDEDPEAILDRARGTGTLDVAGLPDGLREIPQGWVGSGPAEGATRHTFPIRYLGPPSDGALPGTFPAYRASEATALAAFAPELFRDEIVLLGSGWHDTDKFQTPYYGFFPARDGTDRAQGEDHYTYMFGVEIHANAIQNLLDGTFIQRLSTASSVSLLFLLTGMVAGLVFWKGAAWGAVGAGATALGAWLLAYWAYAGSIFLPFVGSVGDLGPGFVWVPVVTPFLAILVTYLGSTAYVSVVEGRDKRFIKSAMGKYVHPDVVKEIAENPDALRLGGQKRSLSVLFSDLAGFTTLSESMAPEELLALLNEYLDAMTHLVIDEAGTLDKYIGDAIMAFWNAPKDQPDHADRALRCAVLMQREMSRLNRKWADRDGRNEPLAVRIGVNTGDVVVGNMGGDQKFDYSAVGDPVNLAARLEPANKTYGTLIMTSEFTLAQARRDEYRVRELDLIAVKGKSEPVRVYEVVEMADRPLDPELTEVLELYESGMSAYRNRDWELAAEYFSAAVEVRPGDGPSRVYLERSRAYITDPPPADWDFVVRRTVK